MTTEVLFLKKVASLLGASLSLSPAECKRYGLAGTSHEELLRAWNAGSKRRRGRIERTVDATIAKARVNQGLVDMGPNLLRKATVVS